MQKILVPTDFSDNALKAIAYASEIAKKSGAVIHLLHVIEPALNLVSMQTDSSRKKAIKERSSELVLQHQTLTDIYSDVRVIKHLSGGKPITSILRYAQKERIDLIVMGTAGASGLKEFFMGSLTAGVIGKTTIPVLTVPASYEMEEPDAILLTTNQFEKNKSILDKIVDFSKLFAAAIHVVVVRDAGDNENAELIYNDEQLNDYLQFLKEAFPDVFFKGELLEGKDFELIIDRYCNENEADVIAMITYPKSFMEKALRKSATKKMAFHSTIPILAIPAIS